MADFKGTGSCLCGGFKYEYTGRPKYMLNCHCTMCRKALGAPYGCFVSVKFPDNFRLIKSDTLRQYKSSERIERYFCGTCGGGLYDKDKAYPDQIFINAGSIDGDPGVKPSLNIFYKYRAPWVTMKDGVTCFDELPPEEMFK